MSEDQFNGAEDGFAVPREQSESGRSSELIGQLVLLRPLDHEKIVDTVHGKNLARFCEALIIVDGDSEDGPKYRNLGETPIFWEVVRRRLSDANPWLAGKIEKIEEGRGYYTIRPPEPDQLDGLRRVLKKHRDDPVPIEQPDPDQSDDAPF